MPIKEKTDVNVYKAIKAKVYDIYTYAYSNCLDSARFLYGAKATSVDYIDGDITLDEFLESFIEKDPFENLPESFNNTIPKGTRNATMHRITVENHP